MTKRITVAALALLGLWLLLAGAVHLVEAARARHGIVATPSASADDSEDEPAVSLGFLLRGRRPGRDLELTYEMRRSDGTWRPIEAGGTRYRAYGVEPGGDSDPAGLKPQLVVNGGDGDRTSALSRIFLAEQVRVHWGGLVTPDGLRERSESVQREHGLSVWPLSLVRRWSSASTTGPLVAWGDERRWSGAPPRRLEVVREPDRSAATWRVPLTGPDGPSSADLRVTLRWVEGPVDAREALEALGWTARR